MPMLAIAALLAGRVFLASAKALPPPEPPSGDQTVGAIHTSRVISWNGVATYVAMAVGAPLGSPLTSISASAALPRWWCWSPPSACCSPARGRRQRDRRRQSALSRGGAQNLALWLGLAFGTVGFGVIATFITLYFAAHSWQGAAFTLRCSASVLSVFAWCWGIPSPAMAESWSPACFVIECLGLLFIWLAPSARWRGSAPSSPARVFAGLPGVGVEAVKQVEEQNQGTALGTYSAFLDLALGLTGRWPAGSPATTIRHPVSAGGDRRRVRFPADFTRTSATAGSGQDVARPGSRNAAGRRHRQNESAIDDDSASVPTSLSVWRQMQDLVAENNRDRATIQPAAVVQSESLTHTVNS